MAKKSKADDDIIAEANARYARCLAFEADNLKEARDDFQKLAGNHWPAEAAQAARNRAPSVHHDQQIARVFAHGNERPATEQARHQGASGR
jgi:hypothetical protein